MPELEVRITKRTDGSAVFHCRRADGTVTWQVQRGPSGAFFPFHDLTHYAVETELGLRRGFYGLLADGWDVEDTTGKGSRGPVPAETLTAENVVGLLDQERAGGVVWAAADFLAAAAAFAAQHGRPGPPAWTDPDLERVRGRVRELFDQWRAVPPGGTLELSFDRPAAAERR